MIFEPDDLPLAVSWWDGVARHLELFHNHQGPRKYEDWNDESRSAYKRFYDRKDADWKAKKNAYYRKKYAEKKAKLALECLGKHA